MIKKNADLLMQKLNFPTDAKKELTLLLDRLLKNDKLIKIIDEYKNSNFDFFKMLDDCKNIACETDSDEYSVYMVVFILLAQQLKEKYSKKGIEDKIFYNTLADLRYKLEECRLVHNRCGTFVPKWYKGFFEMRIFALGRLQFEINYTWFDCEVNGKVIPNGTKVLSVHIPRTGTRLEHSEVVESYSLAKEFFKDEFNEEIIFICNSWLLYPWNRTVLKDSSNLAKFYDDFTIVQSNEYNNYSEVWRLFDCLYDGNPNKLPNDTSLRRAYIERIKSNQPIGYGIGVITK